MAFKGRANPISVRQVGTKPVVKPANPASKPSGRQMLLGALKKRSAVAPKTRSNSAMKKLSGLARAPKR